MENGTKFPIQFELGEEPSHFQSGHSTDGLKYLRMLIISFYLNVVLTIILLFLLGIGAWMLYTMEKNEVDDPNPYHGPYNLTFYSGPGCGGDAVHVSIMFKTCTLVDPPFKTRSASVVGNSCPGMRLWTITKLCVIGPWAYHWIACDICTDLDLEVTSVQCP